jgi:hypothetical protein
MNQDEKLAVYEAQVKNVRALKSGLRLTKQRLNHALASDDKAASESATRIYALLFCAWAEANFSKLVHTPYGFDLDEIAQIKVLQRNGIATAWEKCVELGLRHLDAKRGSFKPNAKQKLEELIKAYVFDPALLRNKLAHGQWVVALNRENTALQPEITSQIGDLNVVLIDSWQRRHEILALAVETLVESPKKTFVRDWFHVVVAIEAELAKTATWTLAGHISVLKRKAERKPKWR